MAHDNLASTQYYWARDSASHLFQNTLQIDVATVLLLLGEGVIWKLIWSRCRSRRQHWKHWIFAISPGWTPLAGSLVAALSGTLHPANLIYDRPPEGSIDSGLVLTHLSSGASHAANNTILQNIWATWEHGPRAKHQATSRGSKYDMTREVGVVEVNIDALHLENRLALRLQALSLFLQIAGSVVMAAVSRNFEPLVVVLMNLTGQAMLVYAITPREAVWRRAVRGHRGQPIMIHRNLDSQGVLIVRRAQVNDKEISLEEYAWKSPTPRNAMDTVKAIAAGLAFLVLIIQIILIGWMQTQSRAMYAILGAIGLAVNTVEAFSSPDWWHSYRQAFTGNPLCTPRNSSAMGAVGVLVAGRFAAHRTAAKMLYPDNPRFADSLSALQSVFDSILCHKCRDQIRNGNLIQANGTSQESHWCQRVVPSVNITNNSPTQGQLHVSTTPSELPDASVSQSSHQSDSLRLRHLPSTEDPSRSSASTSATISPSKTCADLLADAIVTQEDKQLRDGLATVCHYLRYPNWVNSDSPKRQHDPHRGHGILNGLGGSSHRWSFLSSRPQVEETFSSLPTNSIDTSRRSFMYRPGRSAVWNDWNKWM
jgi:hypothetical protein